MDKGCAYDLISSSLAKDGPVRSAETNEKLVSSTANGKIKADTIAPLLCGELNMMVEPFVPAETQSVLSIGRRCM